MSRRSPLVVILVALSRAGKDTAAAYLAKTHGFFRIGFSDLLKAELSKRKLAHSKENMVNVGNELRDLHGRDIVAQLAIQKALKSRRQRLVFSGSRSPEEISRIKEQFARTHVLSIESDLRLRQARAKKSGWSHAGLAAKDRDDIKNKGLDRAIARADLVVKNNSTRGAFYENLDRVVRPLYARTKETP